MPKITLLGTGTSQGIPVISCGCWVCSSDDSRDKRLRCSAMVEHDDMRIVIDAGPDFRTQMLNCQVKRIDGILLTHEHKDHIAGLDDVRAFNYTTKKPVDVYASQRTLAAVKREFNYAFGDNLYPGVPEIDLHTVDPLIPFSIKGIEIVPINGQHYNLPIMGFRIGKLGYMTDFNKIDQAEIEKLKGIEVLVINALRREKHISHFTLDEALHTAYLIGAKQTYLTHLSHQMGRHTAVEPTLPEGTKIGYDGLIIEY